MVPIEISTFGIHTAILMFGFYLKKRMLALFLWNIYLNKHNIISMKKTSGIFTVKKIYLIFISLKRYHCKIIALYCFVREANRPYYFTIIHTMNLHES